MMPKVTTENIRNMFGANMVNFDTINEQAREEHWPDDGRRTFIEFIEELSKSVNKAIDLYGPKLEIQFKEWNEKYAEK